jgi:hypothetical protein
MVIALKGAIHCHEANAWPRLVAPRARHAVVMVAIFQKAYIQSDLAAPCARSLVFVAALGVHADMQSIHTFNFVSAVKGQLILNIAPV